MSDDKISHPLCQYVIPHPTEQKILLLQDDDLTWTLPAVIPTVEEDDFYDFYMFGMQVQHILNFDILTLYQAQCIFHDELSQMRWVYVTDNIKNEYELPSSRGRWISHNELTQLRFTEEHIETILKRYFTEIETGVIPAERVPWAKRGWQNHAFDWVHAQLDKLNFGLVGDIEVVRIWCITALYRIPTNNGDLYFKAVPPTFSREIGVTHWLNTQLPSHIPEVIAFDKEQHFLLMRDFNANILRETENDVALSVWETVLTDFANIQKMTIGQEQTLLDLGALDYRLHQLMPKFKTFLADSDFVGVKHNMPEDHITAIHDALPIIQSHVESLLAMNLPTTLLHNDFHTGNIAIKDDKTIVFDWTDAGIGLPIFDYSTLAYALNNVFKEQPETIQHLRNVYFRALSDDNTSTQWEVAYESSRIISLVMQCVNYHHLLQTAEPNERWVLNFLPQLMSGILQELNPTD